MTHSLLFLNVYLVLCYRDYVYVLINIVSSSIILCLSKKVFYIGMN